MSRTVWALRLLFSGASLVWMAFIFQASSASPQEVNQTLGPFDWLGAYRNIIGHMTVYAILAALLVVSIWTWRRSTNRSTLWALVAATIAIIYGITDEYHQSMVPGRTATALDVLVDGAGALLAALGVTWLADLARRRFF